MLSLELDLSALAWFHDSIVEKLLALLPLLPLARVVEERFSDATASVDDCVNGVELRFPSFEVESLSGVCLVFKDAYTNGSPPECGPS